MFLRQTQRRRTLRMTPPRARASYLCRPPQPVCGGGAVRAGRGPDCATGGACRRRQVGGAVRPDTLAPTVPPGWIVGMGDRTGTYVTRSARHGRSRESRVIQSALRKRSAPRATSRPSAWTEIQSLRSARPRRRHSNRKCLPGSVQSARTARSALIGRPIASEVPPGARMHLFGAHSSFTRARLSSLRARRRFGA
jgi:hypothetical protein